MTDETARGPEPEDGAPVAGERSWSPETGWPSSPAPTQDGAEEPVEASDEPELDAWLDAQDTGWAEQEPPAPTPEPADEPAPAEPSGTGETQLEEPVPAVDEPVPAVDEPASAVDEPASAVDEPASAVEEPASVEDLDAPVAAEPVAADEPATPDEPAEAPVAVPAEPSSAEAQPDAEPVAEAADEPEEQPEAVEAHGADHAAAEVAGAALFTTVPTEVVAAEPTSADVVEDETDELAPAVEAGEPAVPEQRSATALVAALAVLVLLLAGLTGFLAERSVSTRAGGGVEDARHDGLQAARNAARVVFSYDYRHLDKDFAAGKALTTGTFAQQYSTTTPKLVEVAKTYKAVVAADVSDAAVITATTGKVVVLVFVNQQSTSTLAAAPKITQSRVTMTMRHRGGRWLVSDVHAF
jgi:Mce-associated membrane protein